MHSWYSAPDDFCCVLEPINVVSCNPTKSKQLYKNPRKVTLSERPIDRSKGNMYSTNSHWPWRTSKSDVGHCLLQIDGQWGAELGSDRADDGSGVCLS